MTLAFIIAAIIAGILFFLYLDGKEKVIESSTTIKELKSQIASRENDSTLAIYGKQTALTRELVSDTIRRNGFFPLKDDGEWIQFKSQGEVYFISTAALPGVQFYKGFAYSNEDLPLLKKAAEQAMEEDWVGRITFNEEDNTISFRVFGIEYSIEHFTDSFMDYMKMLNNLVDCHRYFYQKLIEENKTYNLQSSQITAPEKDNKILS